MTSCSGNPSVSNNLVEKNEKLAIVQSDTILNALNYWQDDFGLTHDPHIDSVWGKPVYFYISNPKCSPLAIAFYEGSFRPGDNDSTTALLELIITDNNILRPFYRWCLNKTILIQDGALGEYTGAPARRYAEKFPEEFFNYMDIDPSGEKYLQWVNSILYSGFYKEDDYDKPLQIRQKMIAVINKNCKACSPTIKNRITKLAEDCFPEVSHK